MKIAVIGTGYVGLTTAAVFASLEHTVYAVDSDEHKINSLKKKRVPFFEPGLQELVKEQLNRKCLIPTKEIIKAVRNADALFLCVATPQSSRGGADLSYLYAAAKEIARYLSGYTVIATKSTVPVGTGEKLKALIKKYSPPTAAFDMASCPEFLREGSAIADIRKPQRIVIGTDSRRAQNVLADIHKKIKGPRVFTDIRTAEIIKYASNAFLATKISFINEMSNLCEEVGARIDDVAYGMGLDERIGKAFLKAGIGYGGSCFPKDTRALHSIALSHDSSLKLLNAVIEVNRMQRRHFLKKVRTALGTIRGKRIAVLGLAFKNNTDDVRESAAIEIAAALMKKGAKITAFDPRAGENAAKILPKLRITSSPLAAARNADCLLILTEWDEFRTLPWRELKNTMHVALVIDGRNLLDPKKMRRLGFEYISMGR